jgi:D-glycero-D-manno-heptose 1,7-bisphosphate phosphatase
VAGTSAVFVDRDGVINALVRRDDEIDSPQRAAEFRLLPGAARGIMRLNLLDLPVIVVSNQPGIAKGKSTRMLLEETTVLMCRQLAVGGASVTAVYYCLHHPQAVDARYRVECGCRKPRPGLLQAAAADLGVDLESSYMVGDREVDIAAGRAAGCATVLVRSPDAGVHERTTDPLAMGVDFTCGRLDEAAVWIWAQERSKQLNEVIA